MPTSLISTGVQFPDNSIQTTAASAGAMILLQTVTASGASTVGFSGVNSTYSTYIILCTQMSLSVNNVQLNLRHTVGGVPDSTASAYTYANGNMSSTWLYSTGSIDRFVFGINSFFGTTNASLEIRVMLGSSMQDYYVLAKNQGNFLQLASGKSLRNVTVDGFVLYPGTGTVSGTFRLYGIKNS
jgi:hypothetical protein